MSARPDVSIVIVNHNAARQLRQCLASIASHAGGVRVQTIVVDNASSDGSIEMVRAHFPDVVLIANAGNVGYTRANNAGMEVARGRYVVLLNNDTEMLEGALEEMVAFAEAHPDAGAVAPQLLNPDLTMQGNVKRFPTAASAIFGRKSVLTRLFPRNRFSRRYLLYLEHDMSAPFEADYASTACLLVRSETLEQAGRFDTDFFCYWSDADLCQRIKDAGWRIHCVPAARVIHYEGMGGTRTSRRSWRSVVDFNEGAYRYYVKNRLSHPRSPMRALAFVGLSLNAIRQLAENRWGVLMSARMDVRLNPAEVPAADRAIKGLSALAVALVLGVLLLQTQYAAGGGALRPNASEEAAFRPFSEDVDEAADVERLEAEAERSPEVAKELLPQGDSAPRRQGGDAEPSPWPGEPAKPFLRAVGQIAPDAHRYGLVTYMLDPYDPVLDAKIALLAELGVDEVRMDMRWPLIEPEDDRWEFAQFDRAVAKLHAAGIGIVGCVGFTPRWASSAPAGSVEEEAINYPPESPAEYTELVSTLAGRYKGRVGYWQLGIEPDLDSFWRPAPDPAAFVRQLSAGAVAAKAADPDTRIVYPGITTAKKLAFLEETLKLGVADSIDVFAIHDYDNEPEGKIREDVATFVSLVERYSSEPKECWCTEIGWATYAREEGTEDSFIDGVDEAQQREKLVKRWILLRDTALGRVYSWELSDSGDDPNMLLWNLGLLRNDLTPKKAYYAAREVLPLLDGRTKASDAPVTVEGAPDTLEVHTFETERGALVLALWDVDDGMHDLDVRLGTDDFCSPMRLGLDGGEGVPVEARRLPGKLRLNGLRVGREPVILVFGRPALHTSPDVFSPAADGAGARTAIAFSLESTAAASIEVLDAAGEIVATLARETTFAAGPHELTWSGRGGDGTGERLPDGRYRVRLLADGTVSENLVTLDTARPGVSDVVSGFDFWTPGKGPYLFLPLKYRLSEPAHVTVDVFDRQGRFYLQLRSERMQAAGDNSLDWPIQPDAHPAGWYWYRVTATDAAGNVVSRESPSGLLVDLEPPRLDQVSCSPPSFSPDADGVADVTTLGYTISEDADVVASARNAEGKTFYLFIQRHQAAGTYAYAWNGRAYDPETKRMAGLADGEYALQVTAFDERGNRSAAGGAVTIAGGDFSGPRISALAVSPECISPDLDGVGDVGRISFALDEPADVLLTVIAEDGAEYALAAMSGLVRGSHHLDWNGAVPGSDGGRAFLPTGTYTLVASATDRAGNAATSSVAFSLRAADSSAPGVENASVRPATLSPDGDGVHDVTSISFELLETADVIVFVKDRAGRRYDIFGEAGMEPGRHEFEWRGSGYDGARGEQVALRDGTYELCVEASDRLGNVGRYRGHVEIADTGDVPLSVTVTSARMVTRHSAGADGRCRTLRFRYSLTRSADVKIAVRTLSGRHYYIAAFPGQSPGSHVVEWDGVVYDPADGSRSVLGDGTYVYLIDAVSGPSIGVTAAGRVSADFRSPR